jgi:hypothetical protein
LQEKVPGRPSGCKSPRGRLVPLIPQYCRSTWISLTTNHHGSALRGGAGYGSATLGATGYGQG